VGKHYIVRPYSYTVYWNLFSARISVNEKTVIKTPDKAHASITETGNTLRGGQLKREV